MHTKNRTVLIKDHFVIRRQKYQKIVSKGITYFYSTLFDAAYTFVKNIFFTCCGTANVWLPSVSKQPVIYFLIN